MHVSCISTLSTSIPPKYGHIAKIKFTQKIDHFVPQLQSAITPKPFDETTQNQRDDLANSFDYHFD